MAALRDDLAAGRFDPLELGIETIRVETSAGYKPAFEEVVGRISQVATRT